MADAWFLIYVELCPAAESEKLQSKAVSLRLCFLSCLTALSSVVSAPTLFPACYRHSLSLKSFCLLSACISVMGTSKHISCVQSRFQCRHSLLPTWLSKCRLKYLADTQQPRFNKAASKPWPFYCVRAIGTPTCLITSKQSGLRSITVIMKEQKGSFQISCLLLIIPSLFKGLFSDSIAVTSLKLNVDSMQIALPI